MNMHDLILDLEAKWLKIKTTTSILKIVEYNNLFLNQTINDYKFINKYLKHVSGGGGGNDDGARRQELKFLQDYYFWLQNEVIENLKHNDAKILAILKFIDLIISSSSAATTTAAAAAESTKMQINYIHTPTGVYDSLNYINQHSSAFHKNAKINFYKNFKTALLMEIPTTTQKKINYGKRLNPLDLFDYDTINLLNI